MGWVDVKTGDPVDNKDICGKYEKAVLSHANVWILGELILVPALSCLTLFIRAWMFCGYNPKHKIFNLEIELIHNLELLEVTDADTEKFKKEHGDKW